MSDLQAFWLIVSRGLLLPLAGVAAGKLLIDLQVVPWEQKPIHLFLLVVMGLVAFDRWKELKP